VTSTGVCSSPPIPPRSSCPGNAARVCYDPRMVRPASALVAMLLSVAAACSDPDASHEDASVRDGAVADDGGSGMDGAVSDAGDLDAGPPIVDGGPGTDGGAGTDARVPMDGGPIDGGSSESVLRAGSIVRRHADSPWPDRGDCWGDVTWAFSALYVGDDVREANSTLASIPSRYTNSADPTVDGDCYWALPLVARAYLHPATSARLLPMTNRVLEGLMWTYVRRRSRVDDALGSVWAIHASENHDAMRKSNYALFVQALQAAGRGDDVLADGLTVTNHFTAWQRYWKEWFRQRAREGIHVEIASPIYAKYTLQTHYNLRDFARSSILRRLAGDFLTLYFADAAQDFLPSVGVRGGAMTRAYKDAHLTRGSRDGLRPITWIYEWHDAVPGSTNPSILAPATSSWRPPPIVGAIATRRTTPHQYISRRFGQGTTRTDAEGIHYSITFPGGDSSLRRFSYWAPEYVVGTLTVDPAREYVALIDQNRWMGAIFATDPEHRIVVHGRGDIDSGRTGYTEITGITGTACSIVARDPGAESSIGTRIFVSYGAPWTNRVEEGGWLFTRAGDAYAAVRPAAGGWVIHSVADGKMLDMPDMWAPVVLQMGRASDYASFSSFRSSVLANPFDYSGGRLRYESEAGDVYEVWANSDRLPRRNGRVPSLNPAKTYGSPHILSWHGDDTVRLSFPGMTSLVLDFSY